MRRLVLDAGALIAFERGDARLRARLTAARRLGMDVVTTSPVVGQVWRDGRRQALLARLLAATRVHAPTEEAARQAGEILARGGGSNVVDALVVGLADDGDTILTGDVDDVSRLLAAWGRRATVAAL
jgi:predicted nucleic acid-binding protein